jgi:hypothetical protein
MPTPGSSLAADYPDEWCLEALREQEWLFWLHGTMDQVFDEYYYHRDGSSFQRWRITPPEFIH